MEQQKDAPVDQEAVKRITPFVNPQVDPEQLPPDHLSLLSLCCGVVGLMAKVRSNASEISSPGG